MRISLLLILALVLGLGRGTWAIGGEGVGNGTSTVPPGGGNGLGEGVGIGGIKGGGIGEGEASLYGVRVEGATRSWLSEDTGITTAGALETTATKGAGGDILPTTAITANGEEVSGIRTTALDAKTYSIRKDFATPKTTKTTTGDIRGSSTALAAEATSTIRSGSKSPKPTSTTTTTKDIREPSMALVTWSTPAIKSDAKPPKTAVVLDVEDSQTTLQAVLTSRISSDSAVKLELGSSSWSSTKPSENTDWSSSTLPIMTSTSIESICQTTALDGKDLRMSIVSSTNANPSLSITSSRRLSTSSMKTTTATSTTATFATAEATTQRNAALSTTQVKTASSWDSSIPPNARDGMGRSASFVTFLAESSVPEERVSGSTTATEATKRWWVSGSQSSKSVTTSGSSMARKIAATTASSKLLDEDPETARLFGLNMEHTSTEEMIKSMSFKSLIASSSGRVSTTQRNVEQATATPTTSADPEATARSGTGSAIAQGGRMNTSGASFQQTSTDELSESTRSKILTASSSWSKIGVSMSRSTMPTASGSSTPNNSMGGSHSLKSDATTETSTRTSAATTASPERTEQDGEQRNSTTNVSTENEESSTTTQTHMTSLSMTTSFTSKYTPFQSSTSITSGSSLASSGVFEEHILLFTMTRSGASGKSSGSRSAGADPSSRSTAPTVSSMTSNLTEADGNAADFDGPSRTRSHQSPMRSIRIRPTSKIASSMVTITTSSTSLSMTTSFVSESSSSSSTSVTSSMRPKMTDCVDDFDFFEMTDANLAESGTIAWYADWTSRASSGPDASTFHSMGEVPYFGRVWLRNPDYNCGLELGGCTQRPSCNEILKLYPDDAEMARRVYFTMKMQATVNQVMKSYYEAIHTTQTSLASVMKKILDTTFQTTAMDDLQACQFLKTAYNNMYNLMAELAMPILNGKQGLGSDWFKAPVRSEANPSREGIKALQLKDPYGNEKQGFMFWKGKAETAYRWWAQEALGTMAASTAMCEGLGVVNLNKGGAEEGMRNALLKISQFQRKELSQHVQSLNQGAFQGEGDMSAMAGMLGMGIWSNESSSAVDILTDPYQLEEMMTEQSKSSLLSRAYLLNKCYLKCTTHPHASLLCAGYNDWEFAQTHAQKYGYPFDPSHPGPGSKMAEAERLMRTCPSENKVCQVECWSQEKKGWTMPLHNIGQLGAEPLGVDIQSKMGEIYAYYKAHGNVNPHPDEVAAVKDNPAAKLIGEHRGPHFWLPVCDSDQGYTHIVDFGQQKHGKLHMDQFSRSQDRRSFPISCGDYRSDQTPEFMEAMGLTNFKTQNVQWTMNPFFKNYAPLNAAVLIEAPLDNFLALCRLGLQYPQSDTKDVKNGEMDIRREASQFCAPIEKETEGMPWFTANLYFCKKSEAAKELFGLQGPSGGIMGLHKVKNHRRLCERWLATREGEMMQGMEEMDGGQGKDRWIGPKHGGKVEEVHRFQYGSKGKVWHPKWRDRHDLLGSVLLGRRGALSRVEGEAFQTSGYKRGKTGEEETYVYDSKGVQELQKGEESVVQNGLSQCVGQEGIGFGWHFAGLLLGRGGMDAMGGAWKFLFMGHRDLRRFAAEVDFEGSENSCRYVQRGLKGRSVMRKRYVGRDDEGKVDGMAAKITYSVSLDMEEVRREEEMYWKEIEEVMKEEEKENN